MNEEEIKLRDEAYGRLRIWRDGCREIHDRAKESRNILLLQDPKQDEQTKSRRQDKKTIQLQTLKSPFNNCIADQMDSMPEALKLPDGIVPSLVLGLGKPDEDITIEGVGERGIGYYRDADGRHHVPKRSLDEIIL